MEDELSIEKKKCEEETIPKFKSLVNEKDIIAREFIQRPIKCKDNTCLSFLQHNEQTNVDFCTYVMACWMRELSVYLTPDFVQNSILSIFAKLGNASYDDSWLFRREIKWMFSNIDKKIPIQVESYEENIITIINKLFTKISEKSVNTHIVSIGNTKYETDVDGLGRAFSQSCILDIGRTYYDYDVFASICGIKGINVKGNINEWKKLKSNILKLKELFTLIKSKGDPNDPQKFKDYLDNCLIIVDKIIESQINPTEETKRWLMSGISSMHHGENNCGEVTKFEDCNETIYQYEGHYLYPKLCGWLIELTDMNQSREITDLGMSYRVIPFRSVLSDDQIEYVCISACLQFHEENTEKNWEYTFHMNQIDEKEYNYLTHKVIST
jgi:hypothetical protein